MPCNSLLFKFRVNTIVNCSRMNSLLQAHFNQSSLLSTSVAIEGILLLNNCKDVSAKGAEVETGIAVRKFPPRLRYDSYSYEVQRKNIQM